MTAGNTHGETVKLPRTTRLLLRSVYIMGIILVLLVLVLIFGIVWKSVHKPEKPPAPEVASLNLALAPGEAVTQVALDGDHMAVTTASQIIVIDIRKNQVLSRFQLKAP